MVQNLVSEKLPGTPLYIEFDFKLLRIKTCYSIMLTIIIWHSSSKRIKIRYFHISIEASIFLCFTSTKLEALVITNVNRCYNFFGSKEFKSCCR